MATGKVTHWLTHQRADFSPLLTLPQQSETSVAQFY
jgi:hypothetical protein